MDALTSKSKPLTQPFNWLGSKVRMRRRLYEIFKEIPRTMYIEPFGGSGAVFFGKEPGETARDLYAGAPKRRVAPRF